MAKMNLDTLAEIVANGLAEIEENQDQRFDALEEHLTQLQTTLAAIAEFISLTNTYLGQVGQEHGKKRTKK